MGRKPYVCKGCGEPGPYDLMLALDGTPECTYILYRHNCGRYVKVQANKIIDLGDDDDGPSTEGLVGGLVDNGGASDEGG